MTGWIQSSSVVLLLAAVACTGSVEQGEVERITGGPLAEALADDDVFLLDVRRPDELVELGTVEGYTNIPIEELDGRLDELPRDRPILTA
jgi:hypothetical protein